MTATFSTHALSHQAGEQGGQAPADLVALCAKAGGDVGYVAGALGAFVARSQIALVSVDVFDTLVFRGTEPEVVRFRHAAHLAAGWLAEQGVTVDRGVLLAARLAAARAATSLMTAVGGREDVAIERTLSLAADSIGLDRRWCGLLLEAECRSDVEHLHLNLALARDLRRLRGEGRRVVLTSDTQYRADTLASMLLALGAEGCFDDIRTSADYGATKRSGLLFRYLVGEEGCPPDRIVHIGDDASADHHSPRALGLQVLPAPRPPLHRLMLKARKTLARRLKGRN